MRSIMKQQYYMTDELIDDVEQVADTESRTPSSSSATRSTPTTLPLR